MIRPRQPSGLIAVAVVLFAACQGVSSVTPSASSAPEPLAAAVAVSPPSLPVPSVHAEPSPTPAPVPSFDLASAAAAYLAASTARNTAAAAALAKLPRTNATLKQLHAWGLAFAKSERKFVDQIRAIAFPPTMTSKITLFLQQRSMLADLEFRVGTAKTLDDALIEFNKANALSSLAIATATSVRADLGLPPAAVQHN